MKRVMVCVATVALLVLLSVRPAVTASPKTEAAVGAKAKVNDAASAKAKAHNAASAKRPAAPQVNTQAWRDDPVCQMVFFAVLEGLYTDGVSDEVVDLIVPPKTDLDNNVKRCFVFRCPLCHAAYEAFVLYQRRQAFNGTDEKKSTFGKGVDKGIIEALKSDEAHTRVFAMGRLIRPWIQRRFDMMNLDAEQKQAMLDKLIAYAGAGNTMFGEYRNDKNSVYFEWQFYGGCQACEAAKDISRRMNLEKLKGE